ncbi:MAG: RNA polymerase factor sigma-54 [Nitratireductor sp.]
MALTPKLQARQTQSLAMTPQLVQSIKLLQMNSVELLEHVTKELENNPLLELADGTEGQNQRSDTPNIEPEKTQDVEPLEISTKLETSSAALEENLGTSIENEFDTDRSGGEAGNSDSLGPLSGGALQQENSKAQNSLSSSAPISGGAVNYDSDYNLENFVAGERTLRDHLGQQLAMMRMSQSERLVCAEIIDSLDPDGYFRKELTAIATDLGVLESEALDALEIVQSMEPTGIGARDLNENIALQLKEKNRFDPAMELLVQNLDMLAKKDFNGLSKLCSLSLSDIMDMVEEIRVLDPRPARKFDQSPTQEIIIDVFVNSQPDGSFKIELNNEALPKVLINETYQATVKKGVKNRQDKAYIDECIQNANWLTKSLEQRAQTILKVTAEIVKQQDEFFAYGIKHLKPMSLKKVADEIEMHESTVSRVTSNKYLICERGTFELKYFFTAAISAMEGEESHSAKSVRFEIQQLIENETLKNIYSDDAIVKILQDKGIDIARRTVAKYRDAMHIPSSVQRRRSMKAANLIT